MKIVAIIQARIGASRLPNKMLLNLHGYSIIEWVYRRVSQAKKIDQILFALPDAAQDDILAWYMKSIGAEIFRGSENDLVDRYYQTAKYASADVVVRICADNPLICASEIDSLIDFFQKKQCDYAYNHIPKGNSYPDGLGAEICQMKLLEDINEQANKPEYREHLFNYIWNKTDQYQIMTFDPPQELAYPTLKLDIDTMADYQQLLEKPYHIEMNAVDIVKTALS
jgi:spore coat polysaccharide biosynthesis protein SpsF